jgi:hypothetical protein
VTRAVHPALRRLIGDKRASAVTEFALIAPAFLLLMMGIFDFSMQIYAKSVLSGAVNHAGRASSLEGNNSSQTAIDATVTAMVKNVFNNATVTYTRRAYDDFSSVNKAERISKDVDNDGTLDPGDCYIESNGSAGRQLDGGSSGQGTGDEVVLYTASMQITRLFPAWKMLGQPQVTTIKAATLLRNQPFGDNVIAEVCV